MGKDIRAAFRAAADEVDGAAAAVFLEAANGAVKPARVKCGCGRVLDVPAPDLMARAKAIEMLVALGYGKPGTQRDDGADLAEALGKDAGELSAAERRLVLAEAKRRLGKGAGDGEVV